MARFSDLKITVENTAFVGKKKDIEEVFNIEIEVHDYRVVPAKFKKNGVEQCLHLQISIDKKMHVVFTVSTNLIQQIEQVKKEDFPITTIIVKQDRKYVFT